jgi:hypothetical protein
MFAGYPTTKQHCLIAALRLHAGKRRLMPAIFISLPSNLP